MSRYSPEYLTSMKREPMSLNFIRQAIADDAILEAKVIKCDNDLTLTVELGKNIFGIIPFSEVEYLNRESKESSAISKVNKRIKFKPKEIVKNTDGTYNVICSRKESQKECIDNFISKLIPGDIIDARVIRRVNYGLFCDIGCGIVALLPTNNISVTHTIEPERLLSGITRMKVIVKDATDPFKVQLSHRELLGTWEEEVSKFSVGDIVSGMVLSVEEYGVFIRISQNLAGLADPTEIKLKPCDIVSVSVLDIKPENMKIRLNIEERTEFNSDEEMLEAQKLTFKYAISSGHIDEWVYSTPTAKRQISSRY